MKKSIILTAVAVTAIAGVTCYFNSTSTPTPNLDKVGLANLQALTTNESGGGEEKGFDQAHSDCLVPMHIASKAHYYGYETYLDCNGNEYVKKARKYCVSGNNKTCISTTCADFEEEMNKL